MSTPAAITSTDVSLGDYSLRVNTTGDPSMEPILFLHGSGPGVSGLSNWERLIADLGDRYYCIAPDVLGFADSDHPNPPPDGQIPFTELRVATIWRLLDKLGIDRVHLVGNSYGGMMSLKMTVENPERVGKVFLMGSGGMPGLQPTDGLKKLVGFYDDPTETNMAKLLSLFVYAPSSFGDKLNEIAATRLPQATREDVRRSHLAMFDNGPKLAYQPEELARIDKDVLVVVGRDDRIVPVEASHYLAEHIPGARLVVIGQCGHWSQIEYPERFENMVSSLVQGRL